MFSNPAAQAAQSGLYPQVVHAWPATPFSNKRLTISYRSVEEAADNNESL